MRRVRPLLTAVALAAIAQVGLAQPAVPFADAGINAVQFVDRNEGWAVGDDGVVWHSIDGGATWERQKTGTRAALRGLHFVNPYTGWAVGRIEQPNHGGSIGVLLRTADGGLTWDEVGTNVLPGLNAIHFFDDRQGLVCGDGSDAFPGGVFATSDAGKTWRPAEVGACAPSWRAMSFAAGGSRAGVLGGAWSKLATVRYGAATTLGDAEIDPLGGRTVHAVKVGEQRSFAVGDGGMVLTSGDGGKKWGFATLPLSSAALACCDFSSVVAFGSHVWVAGRPGTVVFHSGDHGKTWDLRQTNCPAPIHGLAFINEQEGWAVGELGTILGTKDGGRTWTMRRLGGQRAAALCLHANGRSTPLDAVALLGHADGYLTAAVAFMTADPTTADPKRANDDLRLRQALRLAGGAAGETVWGFPLAAHAEALPPRDLMATWDRAHEGKASDQLLRQAVLAIRLWQPEVIVTDVAAPDAPPADVLVLHAAKEAFKKAADPASFPEQIDVLGLKPWAAKKLYALGRASGPIKGTGTFSASEKVPDTFFGPDASVKLDLTEFHTILADSPKDFAEAALRVLAGDAATATHLCFQLVSHRLPGAEAHANLMQGIDLAHGGSGRREAGRTVLDAAGLAERKKASQERRNLEGLAAAPDLELAGPDKALASLVETMKTMPDDAAARTAHAVAARFVTVGRWAEAREVYALLVDRYPGHPLAIEAFRWMLRYHSGSEPRRRAELQKQVIFQHAAFQPNGGKAVIPAGASNVVNRSTNGMTEERYRIEETEAAPRWYGPCLQLEPKLAAFGPVYSRDPAAWLCLLAARRNLGRHVEAEKFVADYFKANPQAANAAPGADVYRDCLAAEMWSLNRAMIPLAPKPVGYCWHTETRPFLDGRLDDSCWQTYAPMPLKAMAEGKAFAEAYKTEALFAYDDKFLYIAMRCEHPTGVQVAPAAKRTRDENLANHDRVDILLDLDRDYQTYYRFQVDHRGCLAEDCWGDRTWDPKYFVGFQSNATEWTAELAIPLGELTGDRPSHGHSWAVNVSRVVPGQGVQAWSGHAGSEPRPEGMGLLQFRAEK